MQKSHALLFYSFSEGLKEDRWQEKERTRQFERGIFKIQESAASELVRLSSRKGCRRKVTKLEASPISSLSRPPQTRRHGETRILFTIHTLHAHLLDSHFMLFALNCSLRSGVGWVCFHRLEQRTSRDATPVDTHIKIHERFEELSKTCIFIVILLSFILASCVFPLFSLEKNLRKWKVYEQESLSDFFRT